MADKPRKLTPKQLAALAKGRAIRKARARGNTKAAGKAKSHGRKAGGSARKPRKAKAGKPQARKATGLSPAEREGMGLVADLIAAQFAASGRLNECSAWVRGLSDSQRRALLAADRRVRRAAGR